jgi:histone-lysine N-methyltransferase SETMAR
MEDVLLLHGSTQPHVSLQSMEAITKLRWTVLPPLPYTSDLAPSNYHLFGKLKGSIHGTKFEDSDSLQHL